MTRIDRRRPIAAPEPPELVKVWPGPALRPGEYLPGVGREGALVLRIRAEEWIDRGLAVAEKPAAPAEEE